MVNYSATGEIKIFGCSEASKENTINPLFAERNSVYIIKKAKKGILEKHVIKTVNVKTVNKTQGQIYIHYTDTLNQIWMESELTTYAEALDLITEYRLLHDAEIDELLGLC